MPLAKAGADLLLHGTIGVINLRMNQKDNAFPQSMQESVSNIAGYRFVELPDRDELREPFRLQCQKSGLKGTILLSHEGINFFLAGSQDGIDQYLSLIHI